MTGEGNFELVFDGMHIGFFETKDAALAEVVLLATALSGEQEGAALLHHPASN